VADAPSSKLESNIDKGPFLAMGEGHQVAAQDSGYDGDFITVTRENMGQLSKQRDHAKRGIDLTVDERFNTEGTGLLGPMLETDAGNTVIANGHEGQSDRPNEEGSTITLQLRSPSEVAALRSALAQILDQVPKSEWGRLIS
jgi:hypothetical protein